MEKVETGAASIRLELKDGNITIYHGEDGERLQHFEQVAEYAWANMFHSIVEQLTGEEIRNEQ